MQKENCIGSSGNPGSFPWADTYQEIIPHLAHMTAVWSTDYFGCLPRQQYPVRLDHDDVIPNWDCWPGLPRPGRTPSRHRHKVIRSTNGSRKGKIPDPEPGPEPGCVSVCWWIMSRTIQLCVSVCSLLFRILCEPGFPGMLHPVYQPLIFMGAVHSQLSKFPTPGFPGCTDKPMHRIM